MTTPSVTRSKVVLPGSGSGEGGSASGVPPGIRKLAYQSAIAQVKKDFPNATNIRFSIAPGLPNEQAAPTYSWKVTGNFKVNGKGTPEGFGIAGKVAGRTPVAGPTSKGDPVGDFLGKAEGALKGAALATLGIPGLAALGVSGMDPSVKKNVAGKLEGVAQKIGSELSSHAVFFGFGLIGVGAALADMLSKQGAK